MNQTAYQGKEEAVEGKVEGLKAHFEDFIKDEKEMIQNGVKNFTEAKKMTEEAVEGLTSRANDLSKKALQFVRENPALVAGAVVAIGALGFTASKILSSGKSLATSKK